MIEQWCRKSWSRLEPGARNLAARLQRVRPEVWVALIVAALLAGREIARFYHRQIAHRHEIAEAIGAIGFFYGPPQPDRAGSRVLYLRTSEKGLGLFNRELGSGKTTLLREWETPAGRSLGGQKLLPLSPDGRFLPVAVSIDAAPKALVLCETDSGKELARMEIPGQTVAEGAWLAPEKLAWSTQRPVGRSTVFQLNLLERRPDGHWTNQIAPTALTNASCLTALSNGTIAWMDAKGIYTMNLASNTIATLFSAQDKPITRIHYSRERRQFLVTCREKESYSLWRLELKTNEPNDFTQLARDGSIQSAQWVNGVEGYAYLNEHTPVVRADAAATNAQLGQAVTDTLVATSTGDSLFLISLVGHEPGLGLWRYGINHQALTNVVCYSDAPSPRAVRVQPIHCSTTTKAGRPLRYYLYRPAHFNWHKRYPLLMGNTVFGQLASQRNFDGPSWAEVVANCGAYVVMVERQDWFLKNEEEWSRDVLAVLDELKGDPTVDRGKIFLQAVSVETIYLSKFLEQKPDLWKGVLLLNPVSLPDPSAMLKSGKHLPRMLISAGQAEDRSEMFKKFQDAACRRGMMVEVVEHPNAAHVLTSIPSLRSRAHAMEHFIFEE